MLDLADATELATPLSVLRAIRAAQSVSVEDLDAAIAVAEQADSAEFRVASAVMDSSVNSVDSKLVDIARRAAAAHRQYKSKPDDDDELYEALERMYETLNEFELIEWGNVVTPVDSE